MKIAIHKEKSLAIAYDASLADVPGVDYFSVDFWRAKDALIGEAVGRGSVWFIDSHVGPLVLRRYLRGGWAAKLSEQSYFFTKVSRSRPYREFHLLAALYQQGLPVPRPVAALTQHHGFISTGAILTTRILSAQTLADVLPGHNGNLDLGSGFWGSVGKCIRRFHEAGVWHADLNARNILLDAELKVYLIDFDRARFTPGKVIDGQGNLDRLKRSLDKLWPHDRRSELKPAWSQLELAYHA